MKIRYKGYTVPEHGNDPEILHGRDTFETPNYATDLLVPFIPANFEFVWEPAAGSGRIAYRLEEHGFSVIRSDIRDFGGWNVYHNFIGGGPPPCKFDCIITNPPFSLKAQFVEKAVEIGKPFALLISAEYSAQQIKWIREYGCGKIIPSRRIDFITPTGRRGSESASQFHSMWLTRGFGLDRSEVFVDLSIKEKKENI